LGFYGLLLVLKQIRYFFGALAFGFSTYLIIIIGVGHNSKAHAIAYMPLVIAGFILVLGKICSRWFTNHVCDCIRD
jgi:MFS superfamily sulfate permease-like transporter